MLRVVLDSSILVSGFLTEGGATATLLMLVLGAHEGIRIVTPRQFLNLLEGG
jgi:predicted nucleic acid-binding protein